MIASRLTRLFFGAGLVDEDHAAVEIALLAGDAGVDRVGNDMGDAPRILGGGVVLLAGELLAGEHVPQPEFGLHAAALAAHAAGDQRLRIDHAPAVELRHRIDIGDLSRYRRRDRSARTDRCGADCW